jgi:hypothetical protein
MVGILPGTVLFCALGQLAGDVSRFGDVLTGQADAGVWIVRLLGIGATVAVTVLITRVAQNALVSPED